MMCSFYGKNISQQRVRNLAPVSRDGVSLLALSEAAIELGFDAKNYKLDFEDLLSEINVPFVAHLVTNHFVIVHKIEKGNVFIADPEKGLIKITKKEFKKLWCNEGTNCGIILNLEPTDKFHDKEYNDDQKYFKMIYSKIIIYKKLLFFLFLGMLLGSVFQLILPVLTQTLVDKGINPKNLDIVKLVILGQLVLIFSRNTVELVRSRLIMHIGNKLNLRLIYEFLVKLVSLPISFFEKKIISDILQRIGDNYRIENFVTYYFLSIIFVVINFLLFGTILIFYNFNIFLIFIIASILYFLWILSFLKKRKALDTEKFIVRSENQNMVIQLIRGIQDIKLNNAGEIKINEWAKTQTSLYNLNIKSLTINQYQQAGAIIINELKNLLITYLAAAYVISGEITLGMMFAIQYLIGQLSLPIEQFVSFLHSAQDAKISLERLSEINSIESEKSGEKKLSFGNKGITVSNLSFQYGNKYTDYVLKNINAKIPLGSKTAIVGESGSGKTTFIKMLLGIYKPVEGNIFIGNDNIDDLEINYWRSACGVVMQDGYIFQDTIENNITLGDDKIDYKKLNEAVRLSNINELVDSLPLKLKTKIGNEGNGLSEGQKQRLLIARAFYKQPEILFLDEATNSLDSRNEISIMNFIETVFRGKTLIIAAHRLSTIKNADLILVLNKGLLVEQGTHLDLVNSKGYYYKLFNNQLNN